MKYNVYWLIYSLFHELFIYILHIEESSRKDVYNEDNILINNNNSVITNTLHIHNKYINIIAAETAIG